MALKTQKFQAVDRVAADNTALCTDAKQREQAKYTASLLLRIVCELADSIARNEVTHVTLGMPKSKNALLLTVNWPDGSQTRSGGVDVVSLAEQVGKDILDTGGDKEG